ncbi:MAG TPA: glucosaminidase domain-containing protein [Steroidobacteraceae bacterium]|jgi:flagellar protein FlgJ|nr:glucosaminidase domain-containing protein [Steroidobacteraceae bacterium]
MGTPTVAPSFYADFQGLDRLRASAARQDPQALREAARQFEGLFTAMMLKSMRDASLGGGLGDSEETKTYQDMYDQQLSLQMAHGKGLGLAEMLMQQLTRANAAHATATAPASATPATGAAGADKISSAQQVNFVRSLEPLAQSAGQSLGVAPDTLIAQAALETGWGRNMPTDSNGRSSSNLFGVKAGDSWRGTAVQASTTEYQQGTPGTTRAAFRSYGDASQSVGDYVSLLQTSPRYAGALGAGSDVHAFANGLQRGGYATDPDYVNKLVATVATLRQLRAAALKS